MKTTETKYQVDNKNVAYINVPVKKQQCCCCVSKIVFNVPERKTNNSENRQKLIELIAQLQKSYNEEIKNINLYKSQIKGKDQKISDLNSREKQFAKQLQKLELQNNTLRTKDSQYKSKIQKLNDQLIKTQREKQNLIRNKVSFIQANLSEKNLYLQNQIKCLKLNNEEIIKQYQKNTKEKQVKLELQIKNLKQQLRLLQNKNQKQQYLLQRNQQRLKQQANKTSYQKMKRQQNQKEIYKLKLEIELRNSSSNNDIKNLQQKNESLKQKIQSLEIKISSLMNQKQQMIKKNNFNNHDLEQKYKIIQNQDILIKKIEQSHQNQIKNRSEDFLNQLKIQELNFQRKYSQLQQQYVLRTKLIEQQWQLKLRNTQQQLLRQTMKPLPKPEIKKQYIYIQKQVQSSQFKIANEKLLKLTSLNISLESKIQDLEIENKKLKQKIHYFNNLDESFNNERQKWKQEKILFQSKIDSLSKLPQQNFTWVVQKIIESENQYHYNCNPDFRLIPTSDPNVTYRVLSSQNNVQKIAIQQQIFKKSMKQ